MQLYPQLKRYVDLKDKLSVLEYRAIEEELGESTFWFHAIPQELTFLQSPTSNGLSSNTTDLKQIYVSEYEQQQRVLKFKNK